MKYFLLLFTFTLTEAFSFGQTSVYHPFPDSNSVWREEYYYILDPYCLHYIDYNLYIKGDTTIGSYIYHKLYTDGYVWENCYPPGIPIPPYYYDGQYWGAFRQDNANKKVYLNYYGNDTLAYDFNLNVGDTLPVSYLSEFNYVLSIDSVLVGNHYNKRFWLSDGDWDSSFVIEGVGNTYGSFAFIGSYFEAGAFLYCMQIDGQTVWSYDTNNWCELINRTENIVLQDRISISPNPFSIYTTISLNQNLKNVTLTVYNILGKEMKCIKNLSGEKIKLERDNIPIGIYFIHLTQENVTIATRKVIIME